MGHENVRNSMRVALVSSDSSWAHSMAVWLRDGTPWLVEIARDGSEALRVFATASPEVVIVVQHLPTHGLSAIQVCRAIRALSASVGLLLLTECDAVEDKLAAFDVGVDDCVVRSIDRRELRARLKALVRRNSLPQPELTRAAAQMVTSEHRLVHECVVVDLVTQSVTVDGIAVDLSKRQFLLLVYLIRHAGRVVRERELREQVFGAGPSVSRNSTVRNHIHALRSKLGNPGQLIMSVPGGGYCVRVM